jgi:hypothetical protein
MWDIITSACPFLHRNLTLNLERWVQPLLTSQDYKKLLLIVRSHCVMQCLPCCVRSRFNMCSYCVTQCFLWCVSLPCSVLHLSVHPALTWGNKMFNWWDSCCAQTSCNLCRQRSRCIYVYCTMRCTGCLARKLRNGGSWNNNTALRFCLKYAPSFHYVVPPMYIKMGTWII